MCSAAISLTSKALSDINDAQLLLNIKGRVDLFILTMEASNLISFAVLLSNPLCRGGDTPYLDWTNS